MAIFQIIDQYLNGLPASYRALTAICLILIMIWSIFRVFKGYLFYIVIIILLIPGIWSALKIIGLKIAELFGFLLYRI